MHKDNRGFTLIEMLICLSIFGIVVAAAYGFMLSGARSFKTVDNDVMLRLESNLAMNNISNRLMSCNKGVAFKDTNTLYVINTTDGISYTADVFQLRSDKCVYYSSLTATPGSNGSFSVDSKKLASGSLMAKNVTSFTVSFATASANAAVSAELKVTFLSGSQSLAYDKTVALRSNPSQVVIS